jgi:hypothetical protein
VHLPFSGPTGAGNLPRADKLLAQMVAIYARIFLLEAGNSFGLFGDYCNSLGLSMHRVSIKPGKVISLARLAIPHLLRRNLRRWVTSEEALPH